MDLFQRFNHYINSFSLLQPKDHLLITVSGGVDSVVLCELCFRAGYTFTIAHCNFQLRGVESARDEEFVNSIGKKFNVEVLVKKIDTETYAKAQKVSIQVAARELRYQWFEEQLQISNLKSQKLQWIVTAHHLDDNIETVLMNFFKGTGISGMRGMLPKTGKIVRPLLFARKEELLRFAKENNLQWVEDSSNESDKYSRNYLRHQLIPIIEKLYPSAIENLGDNIERFRELEKFHEESLQLQLKKLIEMKGQEVNIPILKLKKIDAVKTILFGLITQYGFNGGRVDEVLHLMESDTGKYLLSATHRILKNRNWLIISPIDALKQEQIVVDKTEANIHFQLGTLHFKNRKYSGNLPSASNGTAMLDARKIAFPLLIRKWKQGDYFYPLGMKKKKKLARFFIDQKLSLAQKEKAWVVEMDKKIIWVVGMRIDDRFKIGPNTMQILQIQFNQKLEK